MLIPLCMLISKLRIPPFLFSFNILFTEIVATYHDSIQEVRHLKGEDLNSLQPKELIMIEEALDNGLTSLHEKHMEHYDRLMKNGKMLEDENKLLAFKLVSDLPKWLTLRTYC
nr:MADS-box transcription factor 2-like [Lolium perenne]